MASGATKATVAVDTEAAMVTTTKATVADTAAAMEVGTMITTTKVTAVAMEVDTETTATTTTRAGAIMEVRQIKVFISACMQPAISGSVSVASGV